jgi:hypothetical protein
MPPALSHFQAMKRTSIRTNAGIIFIRKEQRLCQKVFPGAKESSAKRQIIKIVNITSILDNQRVTTDDFILTIF